MTLYKFRGLQTAHDYDRIIDIIKNGFYCNDVLGFNDMNEGIYIKNSENGKVNLDEKLEYKICSFSGTEALNSELMWGHYANTGRGIVIEVVDCKNIKEVKYGSNDNLNTIEEILTNKSQEWVYEDEYRYLSTDELANNKVKIGKIIKIHFGTPYEKLSNYEEIKVKHKKLKKYYELKERLKEELECLTINNKNHIACKDFDFTNISKKNAK